MASPTNLSIAQESELLPITEIADRAGLAPDEIDPYGRTKAKLTFSAIQRLQSADRGRLVLVTAITPTPAGEGKTTVTVGLAQGLRRIGLAAMPAVREPALGPVFGIKGGATGGGYSQVLPMEDINLFFTGDFPAISAAHNLLSAMVDSHLHHGNKLDMDPAWVTWPRTVDMNDRALRQIVIGLGAGAHGVARESSFVITPASEVMATLCLANSLPNLQERLGRIMVGMNRGRTPIFAKDVEADGAMAMLLRDAWRPNLVQTREGGPAFVHGGPFANIAHGCSSVVATQCALGLCDWVVTEAGFASDLGAEKFMHLVRPEIGQSPDAVVLVVTVRAVRHHGDGDLAAGFANVERHLHHLKQYGVPVVVAVNKFKDDTDAELDALRGLSQAAGVLAVVADPWNGGGAGCEALAEVVAGLPRGGEVSRLYASDAPIREKLHTIVTKVYGGEGFRLTPHATRRLAWLEKQGLDTMPVCIAKTQASLSDQGTLKNAPTGFTVEFSDFRPSIGAGFVVAIAGDIMLMPGLGKRPAAVDMSVDADGQISGLH